MCIFSTAMLITGTTVIFFCSFVLNKNCQNKRQVENVKKKNNSLIYTGKVKNTKTIIFIFFHNLIFFSAVLILS